MPTLARKELDLSEAKKKKKAGEDEDGEEVTPKKKPARPAPKPQTRRLLGSDDDEDDDVDDVSEDDDDDEIIEGAKKDKEQGGNKKIMFGLIGAVVVVVVVALFLILGRRNTEPEAPVDDLPPVQQQTVVETPPAPTVAPDDPTIGMQDFSKGDNMTSTSPMSDPDNFTKDIQGLTTRVNFDVDRIYTAADMVTYTKMRGTWGGGLELYWLEVVYKDSKYVVQVPFQYYKELDDTGIIPVKMEVLRIKSETSDEYLSVVSYMELDVNTLQTIQRSQSKR